MENHYKNLQARRLSDVILKKIKCSKLKNGTETKRQTDRQTEREREYYESKTVNMTVLTCTNYVHHPLLFS